MIKPIKIGALAVAGALALAACSGGDDASGSAGGEVLIVGTDLPIQGASADASKSTNEVVALVLEQAGGKAGDYAVEIKEYDDSTLEDPINYAFFMGPSMLAVLVYVLFKRPEDCFHYFNRIPFVVYSKY